MTDSDKTPKDLLSEAEKAQSAGDFPKALLLYADVLAKVPGHLKAKKAVLKMRRAAGLSMQLTQADVNEAVESLKNADFEAAASQTRLSLVLAPQESVLYNILGMALSSQKNYKVAIPAFQNAIKFNPKFAEAYGNLGTAYLHVNQPEKAIVYLEKAIRIESRQAIVHHSLAFAYLSLNMIDLSLASINRALRVDPGFSKACVTKGLILRENGNAAEAIECLKNGIVNDPKNISLQIGLGISFAASGLLEKAKETLIAALSNHSETADRNLEPEMAEGFRYLASITKFEPDDPLIFQMETVVKEQVDSPVFRMHLNYGLSKAYEETKQYAKAFKSMEIANREKRKIVNPYSTAARKERVASLIDVFSTEFCERFGRSSSDSKKPIFVVGMNRSGTTLVEQILASHSQVFGAGELAFVNAFANKNFDKMKKLTDAERVQFTGDYLSYISNLAPDAKHVVDKLPTNFNWIGLIKAAFPNAKVINVNRDPRDVCLSNFKNYFDTKGNEYAYDLEELAEYYLTYQRLMEHWHKIFPGQIYDLSYEALTSDQEGESRKLLEYCDLEWEDSVLEFHKSERTVLTASVGQVRQKMYQSSVKLWQHYEDQMQPAFGILEQAGLLSDGK